MASQPVKMALWRGMQAVWRQLPGPVQSPLRSLLSVTGVQARLRALAVPPPAGDGFLTLTPETPGAIAACLQRSAAAGLVGDYYEFGLFRGYTFWHAQRTATALNLGRMRFFGFDSFAGLPEPAGVDAATKEFARGDYACGEDQVRAFLTAHGVDWARTVLIKGFYDRSLTPELKRELAAGPVAVALIDCDLYHSTVPVLAFLADRLQDGSILLFDDWNCFGKSDEHGERRAFHEFLVARPEWEAEEFVSFGWHGQAFIMRRRTAL